MSQISIPRCFYEVRPALLYSVIMQRHFWGSIVHWLWEVDTRLERCGKLDEQQQTKVFLQLMAGIPEDVIEKRCNDLERDFNGDLVLYWALVHEDIIHAYDKSNRYIYAHICTIDPTVEDTPYYHVYLIAALASAILLVAVSKIYPDLGRPTDLAMIGFDAKVPTMDGLGESILTVAIEQHSLEALLGHYDASVFLLLQAAGFTVAFVSKHVPIDRVKALLAGRVHGISWRSIAVLIHQCAQTDRHCSISRFRSGLEKWLFDVCAAMNIPATRIQVIMQSDLEQLEARLRMGGVEKLEDIQYSSGLLNWMTSIIGVR